MVEAFRFALWVASAIAVMGVAARPRNRTPWALLAGVVLCKALDHYGVEFNFLFWWLIDVLVISIIVPIDAGFNIRRAVRHMSRADMSIVLLFPVAWLVYLTPDPWRFYGSTAVVIAQLLLTFPFARFYVRAKENFKNRDDWTNLDLRVAA